MEDIMVVEAGGYSGDWAGSGVHPLQLEVIMVLVEAVVMVRGAAGGGVGAWVKVLVEQILLKMDLVVQGGGNDWGRN